MSFEACVPAELKAIVFRHLNISDLLSLRTTCKSIQFALDKYFFKTFLKIGDYEDDDFRASKIRPVALGNFINNLSKIARENLYCIKFLDETCTKFIDSVILADLRKAIFVNHSANSLDIMLKYIPTTLTSLDLEYCTFPNFIPFLKLLEIRLQGISCDDESLRLLSKCSILTSLCVENCGFVTGTFLFDISKSVTSLQINWCTRLVNISAIPSFNKLHNLVLRQQVFQFSDMKMLPNSITRLELETTFNQLNNFTFPTSLKNLKITGIYPLHNFCTQLPVSVTNFSVSWCEIPSRFTFPTQITELELSKNQYYSWKCLSSNLKKLSVELDKYQWYDKSWIPLLSSGVDELTITTHSGTPSNTKLNEFFENIRTLSTVSKVIFCCDSEQFVWYR